MFPAKQDAPGLNDSNHLDEVEESILQDASAYEANKARQLEEEIQSLFEGDTTADDQAVISSSGLMGANIFVGPDRGRISRPNFFECSSLNNNSRKLKSRWKYQFS